MANTKNETRISDFLLVHRMLRIVCHQLDADFVDIRIEFAPVSEPSFMGDAIILPEEETLPRNMFAIVAIYIDYLEHIVGVRIDSEDDKDAIVNFALSVVRGLAYDYENPNINSIESEKGDAFAMRLDQFPMVWTLLKSIICPANRIEFRNLRVIAGHSGIADACVYVEDDSSSSESPFLFVNLDIESNAVRAAFLLYEALGALSETDAEVIDMINNTFDNFFMKERMVDFVRMSFMNNQEAASFFAVLSVLCSSEGLERVAFEVFQDSDDPMQRTAQMATNWWFLGLTEKMLEPARGEDWSVYETWKGITDELWGRVETERRRRGLDEVPFEMLLRIQSDDRQVDEKSTLQGLLSEDRIW
jgi:hypothetical protein